MIKYNDNDYYDGCRREARSDLPFKRVICVEI